MGRHRDPAALQGNVPGVPRAVEWQNKRGRRGIITQSSPLGESRHSGMLALDSVRFVGFDESAWGAVALEACGKCKTNQGGFHTYTSNLTFISEGCAAHWLVAGLLAVAWQCHNKLQ